MYDLDKKFIFTHPHKCGGTSIESMLGFLSLREKRPEINVFKHGSLEMHINEIKLKNFSVHDFFKFSIIRNPWDRAVSFYNHNKYKEYDYFINEASNKEMPMNVKDSRQMTFKQFVTKYYKNDFNFRVSTKPFMFFQGEFALDYVIKLENLKEDLFNIISQLQIDPNISIPHFNNSEKYSARRDYREYYDSETKNIIGKLFEWDIQTFEYKF